MRPQSGRLTPAPIHPPFLLQELLGKSVVCIGAGTPNRLAKLAEMEVGRAACFVGAVGVGSRVGTYPTGVAWKGSITFPAPHGARHLGRPHGERAGVSGSESWQRRRAGRPGACCCVYLHRMRARSACPCCCRAAPLARGAGSATKREDVRGRTGDLHAGAQAGQAAVRGPGHLARREEAVRRLPLPEGSFVSVAGEET